MKAAICKIKLNMFPQLGRLHRSLPYCSPVFHFEREAEKSQHCHFECEAEKSLSIVISNVQRRNLSIVISNAKRRNPSALSFRTRSGEIPQHCHFEREAEKSYPLQKDFSVASLLRNDKKGRSARQAGHLLRNCFQTSILRQKPSSAGGRA